MYLNPYIAYTNKANTFTQNNTFSDTLSVGKGGYFAGNVGIGTPTPIYALDVIGEGRFGVGQMAYLSDAFASGASWQNWVVGTSYYDGSNFITNQNGSNHVYAISGGGGISGGGYGMHFYITPSTGSTNRTDSPATFGGYEKMTILESGNVGIGTTSPRKLADFLSTSKSQLRLSYTDNSVFTDFTTNASGNLTIAPSGGNVGIGTASPAYALDMAAGDVYGYNGTVMAQASTTLFNYFLGGAGTIGAAATGTRNTGTGYQALSNLTTGVQNTANGYHSLSNNTTGNYNTANGYASLYANTTGSYNTANGYASLYYNTTGVDNTANGMYSLYSNTTNIATLGAITGGSGYTPGTYTGVQMTLSSGSSATTYPIATIIASSTGAITSVVITTNGLGFKDTTTFLTAPTSSLGGTGSGFKVAVASLSTGQYNTAYGFQAGRFISGGVGLNETSTYSTYIGYNAYPLASGDTNETVIGNGAVGSGSNTVTLGGTGTTGTIIPYGNVGIGTTTPRKLADFLSTSQSQLRLSYTDNSVFTDFTTNSSGNLTIAPSGGNATFAGTIKIASYIVSGLPSASTVGAGTFAYVIDALLTPAAGLGLAVTGGGTYKASVISDGTNWIEQ